MSLNKISINDTTIVNTGIVYDISKAHAGATYTDLTDALGTDGENVPAEVREGGMSVKFIQTSNNRYVQYRLMANEFTTDTTQWDISDESVYVENPEYIKVEKDADERVINAIIPDGTNYLPKANIDELSLDGGVLDNDAVKSHTYTETLEFIDVVKDADGRVIEAIKPNGTKVLNNVETNTLNAEEIVTKRLNVSGEDIDTDVITSNKYEDNPEFIRVEKDADGRILSCTNPDGSHYIHNVESETIPDEFSNIDDVENRMEISKDSDGRIIAYRDSNGKLYENVGLETPVIDTETINTKSVSADSLTLSKVGLTEFEQALKENGFTGGQGDWSTASTLHIPEPRCAMINITSADGKPYSWPTSKFVDNKVWVEFYDM